MKAYRKQSDCKNKLVEVGGHNIKLGFSNFEFFYYKHETTETYYIIEKSTGASVSCDLLLSDARVMALERLNRVGIDGFQKMIDNELAKRKGVT